MPRCRSFLACIGDSKGRGFGPSRLAHPVVSVVGARGRRVPSNRPEEKRSFVELASPVLGAKRMGPV